MSYNYLTQYSSPNYTPQGDCVATWGVSRKLYAHEGAKIAIHWWGDPNTNPSFEGVISTLCNPSRGASSHFVATGTGRRVACLVDLPNASWATNSANPYTFSIECDPRCRDEDYDVVAELIAELRREYGELPLVPHRQFLATACPGNYDLARLDALARTKIAGAEFGTSTNPVVAPPVDERPLWLKNLVKYPTSVTKYAIDDITPLRDLANVATVVKNITKATPLEIAGETTVNGITYLMTKYAVTNIKGQGFDVYELQDNDPNVVPPAPVTPTDPTTVEDERIGAIEKRVSTLEGLVKRIVEFLTGLFKNF